MLILRMMEGPRAGLGDVQDRRDRDLIARTASGDERGFVELYRRYAPAAMGLAVRVLGDQALAEEVLQEVFVGVWRRAAFYDPARGSVRSWLLAQVHNRAVDVVRREEAERRRASTHAAPVPGDPSGGLEGVIEEGWLAARRDQVRAAMRALPEEQRRVIELAYFDGLTQTEVSGAMSIPLGTVKSRTLAAMRRLRAALRPGLVAEEAEA